VRARSRVAWDDDLAISLRRILLSSLQAPPITAIKIEGARHEFTDDPDVVEDVTDIVAHPEPKRSCSSASTRRRGHRIEKDGEGRSGGATSSSRTESGADPDTMCSLSRARSCARSCRWARAAATSRPSVTRPRRCAGRRHRNRSAVLAESEGQLPGDERARGQQTDYDRPKTSRSGRTATGKPPEEAVASPRDPTDILDLHQLSRGRRARSRDGRLEGAGQLNETSGSP